MPLPVIYLLILAWFALVGYLVQQARHYEYDYNVLPDLLRRRREKALEDSAWLRLIEPVVNVLAALVPRLGMRTHVARTRHTLIQAGSPQGHTAETFIAQALTHAILAWTGVLVAFLLIDGSVEPFLGLLPAIAVYAVAHQNLKTEADRRKVLIDRHMPYFLDLMSLTMGAGSTFLEACETIASGTTSGPLVDEMRIMLGEVRAGTRFTEALRNMTRRSESEELGLMVQAVRQGEELGTPLVDIFETQAETNRYRRTKRGEQIAARLPNRLALPNTLLMLSVLLLLFGPIIVKAVRGELM